MFEGSRLAIVAATALSAGAFAASASACGVTGSRPGTPNEELSEAKSSSSITVSWINRVRLGQYGGHIFIDISARKAGSNDTSLDKVNMKYTGDWGTRSSYKYEGLAPNTRYCFQIWTRKEPNGCRSAQATNWTCTTTLAVSAPPPPPQKPVKTLGKKFNIAVYPQSGNVFRIRIVGSQTDAPVTIRVADASGASVYITHVGAWRINAGPKREVDVKLSGLCKRPGQLYFSANDGRKSTADKTGTLWTNTEQGTCR